MYNPEIKDYEKEYSVFAEERAGKSGVRFFRRGFPFAKGILKGDYSDFHIEGRTRTKFYM